MEEVHHSHMETGIYIFACPKRALSDLFCDGYDAAPTVLLTAHNKLKYSKTCCTSKDKD